MARSYDGVNDGNSIPDISGVSDFTVAAWLRFDNNNNGRLLAWDNYPSAPRDNFTANAQDATNFRVELNVAGTGELRTLATGYDTSWHHWCVTRTGTTAKIYIDGSQDGSNVTVGSGSFTIPNIRFGCHYFSSANQLWADGHVAEWGLYSVVLDAAEVSALADGFSPVAVRPQSLLRYIPFVRTPIEQITGATVSDIDSPSVSVHARVFNPTRRKTAVPGAAAGGTVPPLHYHHRHHNLAG